jgi:hypothetical protein
MSELEAVVTLHEIKIGFVLLYGEVVEVVIETEIDASVCGVRVFSAVVTVICL